MACVPSGHTTCAEAAERIKRSIGHAIAVAVLAVLALTGYRVYVTTALKACRILLFSLLMGPVLIRDRTFLRSLADKKGARIAHHMMQQIGGCLHHPSKAITAHHEFTKGAMFDGQVLRTPRPCTQQDLGGETSQFDPPWKKEDRPHPIG